MISRLPKWVELGAFVLALVAGVVNAIALLGFEHQAVSHLSGTATLLGTHLTNPSSALLHLVLLLVSFVAGSAVAGALLHGATLKLGRHYDTALLLEAVLLLMALGLLYFGSYHGHYFASAACGLQNALATTYSGAIVRTTHMTGIFTDLGIMLGARWRGEPFDRRKAQLFLLIISGFIGGGALGAWLFREYHFMALLLPIGVCLGLAFLYRVYLVEQRFDSPE